MYLNFTGILSYNYQSIWEDEEQLHFDALLRNSKDLYLVGTRQQRSSDELQHLRTSNNLPKELLHLTVRTTPDYLTEKWGCHNLIRLMTLSLETLQLNNENAHIKHTLLPAQSQQLAIASANFARKRSLSVSASRASFSMTPWSVITAKFSLSL